MTKTLALAAKAKRVNEHTNPAYRWVALAIVLAGAASLIYGIISWRSGGDFGVYFALFGFAAVFFFSGAHVLPTAKNNRSAVERAWTQAVDAMENIPARGFSAARALRASHRGKAHGPHPARGPRSEHCGGTGGA